MRAIMHSVFLFTHTDTHSILYYSFFFIRSTRANTFTLILLSHSHTQAILRFFLMIMKASFELRHHTVFLLLTPNFAIHTYISKPLHQRKKLCDH
jgi:hypothetical protein